MKTKKYNEKSKLETVNKALQKRLAHINQINETLENELKAGKSKKNKNILLMIRLTTT